MMKKLFNVVLLVLAINFIAAAGAVGWLFKSGKITPELKAEVKKIFQPPPPEPSATQPVEPKEPAPSERLTELLAQKSGLPAGQQLEYLQQTFDTRVAELDRREKEVLALKMQVEAAQAQLSADRAALLESQKQVAAREDEATRRAADQGFQESLALYKAMPAKKAKEVFAQLDDETLARYLRAMDPRQASKIVREFKTPAENNRIKQILEKIRQADGENKPAPAVPDAEQPAADAGSPAQQE